MRQLTPTEQAWPWVRFPVLSPEMQAERDKLDYLIDDPGGGLRRQSHGVHVSGKLRVRNHRGLIASIEQGLDAGVLLPPIHGYFGRFVETVPEVWHLWDGAHRTYVAMLRGEKGVYVHNSRRVPLEGPIVWVDFEELDLTPAELESTFGDVRRQGAFNCPRGQFRGAGRHRGQRRQNAQSAQAPEAEAVRRRTRGESRRSGGGRHSQTLAARRPAHAACGGFGATPHQS